jgi:protein-disulfide isomerase
MFNNQDKIGEMIDTELIRLNATKETNTKSKLIFDCMSNETTISYIADDLIMGYQLGITGVPVFFLNGVKYVGAQPYETIKKIIDTELKK